MAVLVFRIRSIEARKSPPATFLNAAKEDVPCEYVFVKLLPVPGSKFAKNNIDPHFHVKKYTRKVEHVYSHSRGAGHCQAEFRRDLQRQRFPPGTGDDLSPGVVGLREFSYHPGENLQTDMGSVPIPATVSSG